MMDEINFFKICSFELNKTLVFGHNIKEEQRVFEDYLIVKAMTYYDLCGNYLKNHEWRDHKISERNFEFEEE